MFQNITQNIDEKESVNKINKDLNINSIIKDMFKIKNIILYLITIIISSLSIDNSIMPFGLAMVAASLSEGIPIFGIFISALIGTSIGNGVEGFLNLLLSSIIYFALIIIKKPKIASEERNEILKTGGRLFWANLIITFFQNLSGDILIYDVFSGILSAGLTYVFYKVFVNGLVVIKEWNNKFAFTTEELISIAIIFSMVSLVFTEFSVFGLNISNIIIIFIIMVLGLKNGLLVGCAGGLSIGTVISLIQLQDAFQIAVFAVSGILAGLLNRFGKIGVIIGFICGNSLLMYLSNGQTLHIIYYREIFIAAIALLFVPDKVKIDIKGMFKNDRLLSDAGENRLYQNDDILNKINIVTDTVSDISISDEIDNDLCEKFKDILVENLEEYENNIFYSDIIDENNSIMDDLYRCLQASDIILEKDFTNILKNHNNFIVMKDETIRNDLQDIIKIINRSYKMLQIEVVKYHEKNNTVKSINKELKEFSGIVKKIITTSKDNTDFEKKESELFKLINDNGYKLEKIIIKQLKNEKYIIEIFFKDYSIIGQTEINNIEKILTKYFKQSIKFQNNYYTSNSKHIYMTEDKYELEIGSSKVTKEGSDVSGDCSLQIKLEDGRYLLAISDGMGSGRKAREASKMTVNTLEKLCINDFDEETIISMINDVINNKTDSEMYATLDLSILDLYKGKMKNIKNGACNTYIKNKRNVSIIKSGSMPIGIVDNIEVNSQVVNLSDGDIIIMCSDGILNYKKNLNEAWIEDYIKNITTSNVQKIAEMIISEIVDGNYGKVPDDTTVIVAKVISKK